MLFNEVEGVAIHTLFRDNSFVRKNNHSSEQKFLVQLLVTKSWSQTIVSIGKDLLIHDSTLKWKEKNKNLATLKKL